jgi:hypothetical protein
MRVDLHPADRIRRGGRIAVSAITMIAIAMAVLLVVALMVMELVGGRHFRFHWRIACSITSCDFA